MLQVYLQSGCRGVLIANGSFLEEHFHRTGFAIWLPGSKLLQRTWPGPAAVVISRSWVPKRVLSSNGFCALVAGVQTDADDIARAAGPGISQAQSQKLPKQAVSSNRVYALVAAVKVAAKRMAWAGCRGISDGSQLQARLPKKGPSSNWFCALFARVEITADDMARARCRGVFDDTALQKLNACYCINELVKEKEIAMDPGFKVATL
jgi:hypothetical protein